MGQYRSDDVIGLPYLQRAPGLENARCFVKNPLGRGTKWNHHAEIFHDDNVELFVIEGQRKLSQVVLNEFPIDSLPL